MKVKIKPFSINDPEKPFEEDDLNREEYAKVLMQFFSNTEESLTLAINSSWGTGKTTFVLMLQQLLENNGIPTILFNAWENDYSDDALISLIGEIVAKIKEDKNKNHIMKEDIAKQVVEDGAKLIRALPSATKILSGGQLDYSVENLDKINQEMTYSFAKQRLIKYAQNKKDITQFKKHLKEYVESITNLGKAEFKPLIFFIDELDRCRPNYTIELLEKLKHIFDIEGIIFVLSIDKVELEKTIKVIYGDIDIDGYLRKFIDFSYNLPEPSIEKFCLHLMNKYGFNVYFSDKKNKDFEYAIKRIVAITSTFAQSFGFSLRKIEQCFSQLSIVLKTTKNSSNFFPLFTMFLIFLKNYDEKIYKQYTTMSINYTSLISYLNKIPNLKTFMSTNYGFALESYFILASEEHGKKVSELEKKVGSGNAVDKEIMIMSSIREIMKNRPMFFMSNNLIKHITKKIEITDSFNIESGDSNG